MWWFCNNWSVLASLDYLFNPIFNYFVNSNSVMSDCAIKSVTFSNFWGDILFKLKEGSLIWFLALASKRRLFFTVLFRVFVWNLCYVLIDGNLSLLFLCNQVNQSRISFTNSLSMSSYQDGTESGADGIAWIIDFFGRVLLCFWGVLLSSLYLYLKFRISLFVRNLSRF